MTHTARPQTPFLLAAVAIACMSLWASGTAEARSERTTTYRYEQIWPTAIRFLRVDMGYEVVEKDREAGYVLFEVNEENKRFRGALELVRFKDERDRPAVRMVVSIEDRPAYMEVTVLERLERKLRQDYGEPPTFVPAPDKKEPEKDTAWRPSPGVKRTFERAL